MRTERTEKLITIQVTEAERDIILRALDQAVTYKIDEQREYITRKNCAWTDKARIAHENTAEVLKEEWQAISELIGRLEN